MVKIYKYFHEAENCYCFEQMTLKAIAIKLNLNTKTLTAWKKLGNWESKRKQYNMKKFSFNKELRHLSIKLMQYIEKDIELARKPCQISLYLLAIIIPIVFEQEREFNYG